MGREATLRAGSRILPACSAVVLMLGSSVALADEASTGNDGLLKFTNVRVVNAPAPVASTAAMQSGYRVYKDSATGELRAPTAEEMQAVATEQPGQSSNMQKNITATGATRVVLDESFLQYSMVVRQPDGSLAEICVTGADKANEVITQATSASSVQEARNVR